jgi:phosphoserine phosphatase
MSNAMAVGDSVDDRCMVAHAGKGIAFCTNDEVLRTVAYQAIDKHSFQPMLQLA